MTEYTGVENIANSVPIIISSDFLMDIEDLICFLFSFNLPLLPFLKTPLFHVNFSSKTLVLNLDLSKWGWALGTHLMTFIGTCSSGLPSSTEWVSYVFQLGEMFSSPPVECNWGSPLLQFLFPASHEQKVHQSPREEKTKASRTENGKSLYPC